jgi:hypothetical protein
MDPDADPGGAKTEHSKSATNGTIMDMEIFTEGFGREIYTGSERHQNINLNQNDEADPQHCYEHRPPNVTESPQLLLCYFDLDFIKFHSNK